MIYGPRIEASYFPVVNSLTNVELKQDGNDVILTATMNKLRNCEYIGASWYKQDGNGVKDQLRYVSLVDAGDSPPTRPVGKQLVGPLSIRGITVQQMGLNVYAEIVHRCHPMWLTTTQLYP